MRQLDRVKFLGSASSRRRTRSMSSGPRDEATRTLQFPHGEGSFVSAPSVSAEGLDHSATHRRRVNPTSLAHRLGPELVKELEALLTPGMTEMPSFAARQAIQKKYNIDRRHIYDWYHTKGLRVSTKEKDTSRAIGQGKTLRSRIMHKVGPQIADDVNFVDLPCIWRCFAQQPSISPSLSTPSVSVDDPLGDEYPDSTSTPMLPLTPTCSGSNGSPFREVVLQPSAFPIQYFLDDSRDACVSPHGATSVCLSEPSVTNLVPQPTADRTQHLQADKVPCFPTGLAGETDCDISSPPSVGNSNRDLYPTLSDHPLPQDQRQAFYRYLSNALGPAHGVQESVGSYKTYMTQQLQAYYERLLPCPSWPPASLPLSSTGIPVSMTVSRSSISRRDNSPLDGLLCSSLSDMPISQETDYRKWLLYGRRSLGSGAIHSPMWTPFAAISGIWERENTLWHRTSLPTTSLDAPEPLLDINDILESPVLRSRHPTSACLDRKIASGHPDSSQTSQLPVTGVSTSGNGLTADGSDFGQADMFSGFPSPPTAHSNFKMVLHSGH